MDYIIQFSQAQLEMVADYIWTHNRHIRPVFESQQSIVENIHDIIVRTAQENCRLVELEKKTNKSFNSQWVSYTGTMGFYALFSLAYEADNEIAIDVELLVDPCIGKEDKAVIKELVDRT